MIIIIMTITSARYPDPLIVNKKPKKRKCRRGDFAVLADHKVKLIENEKRSNKRSKKKNKKNYRARR